MPSGMAGWFSVENWDDGKQVGDDGKMVEIIRIRRLQECLKTFTGEEWLRIMHEALELRGKMKSDAKPKRRRKQRAATPEISLAEIDADDGFDYHDLRSDPIEPVESEH